MNKELDASKRKRRQIRIKTKHPDGTAFDGIVLENKKSFVAILEFTSFEPDGITIVPKKWIKSIRDGKYEKCANEIIRSTGVLDSAGDSKWLAKLDTLEEVIAYLKEEDIWPAIEVIYKDESPLYIGPITEALKNSFKIFCYDAKGNWEKEYELTYREVFKIEINSKYVRRFNEYMRKKRKP